MVACSYQRVAVVVVIIVSAPQELAEQQLRVAGWTGHGVSRSNRH